VSAGRFGPRKLPSTPTAVLEELIELAQRFGRDPEFSRGGGGNASAKVDGVLYIKPSGVALATLTVEDLVPLDMAPLLALLHADDTAAGESAADPREDRLMRTAMAARLADTGGRRPSVELLFHAFLPERFVLHTHPVLINAVTCNSNGAALAARLFGDDALWVPYTDPGLPLARAVVEARRAFVARTGQPAPPITLMQNHGIIVAAETPSEIEQRSTWLVDTVRAAMTAAETTGEAAAEGDPEGMDPDRSRALVDAIAPTLRGLLASDAVFRMVTFDAAPLAAAFTASPAGRGVVLGGPLTPDQIVYAGSWPLVVDAPENVVYDFVPTLLRDRLAEHVVAHATPPIIVIVPRLGLFAAGETWDQADTARHVYLDMLRVAEGALCIGGVRALADAERAFIETWEAEVYRRGVAAAR
jgi:rhamnose utilization protein RhaD (predicted bifunctional aldolase and dehydrogenase)